MSTAIEAAPPARTEAPAGAGPGAMSHRNILIALSGLLLGMFVAILSSTVVSNALPTILTDLHGGQSAYTWVVTATLLTTTATTPIWGKLADLVDKKLLVQIALVIFVGASALAGLSHSIGMLIGMRAVQGIGVGGLTALAQVVMAAIIAPRERGRYSGYLGAVFAVATVGGPLIGGVIVDTSWLGWRWCFYVGVPFAIVAFIVLQRTLHLPVVKRHVTVDYLGATLITAAVSLLLIWVSFAGNQFDWVSWQTAAMLAGTAVLVALFLRTEQRSAEPIVPLHLFKNRTIALSTVASLCVGVGMFGASVFLAQYFQIARGNSPTMSGLMTLPMIAGLFVSSTVSGRIITATGRWKRFLVGGGAALTVGFLLMGLARVDTPYWQLAIFMALFGIGVGMVMQNLVLAVQNTVSSSELGVASSVVAFFRSLGGAVGVAVLGAVLANRVGSYTSDGLAAIGVKGGTGSGNAIPDLKTLPVPVREVVESAYGHAAGDIFLVAAPFGLAVLLAVIFIKEVALRQSSGLSMAEDEASAAAAGVDPIEAAADRGSAYAVVDAVAVDTVGLDVDRRSVLAPEAGEVVTPLGAHGRHEAGHGRHEVRHGADFAQAEKGQSRSNTPSNG